MKQTTFAGLAYSQKKKQTRREKFLTEMDQVMNRPGFVGGSRP